ncbi:MAG: PHP domain-containing protein [Cytophagales bacterium]|nr:PHP domain-containing protein [Cytophagales bacterium]
MLLDNSTIVKILRTTANLLALHGENPFKVRHYNKAAFHIEKIEQDLTTLSPEALANLEGLGKSITASIHEICTTGTLALWETLMAKTPPGVIEMLDLSGIGPKKIQTIWKTLGMTSLEDLLTACEEDKIAPLNGFGKKTQETIKESVLFKLAHQGKFHYATVLPYAVQIENALKQAFPTVLIACVGALRRKMEVITAIEILVGTEEVTQVMQWLDKTTFLQKEQKISGPFAWRGKFVDLDVKVVILFCAQQAFYKNLLLQTGSEKHLAMPVHTEKSLGQLLAESQPSSEEDFYKEANLSLIAPELREGMFELDVARQNKLPPLLEVQDLKGIIHTHTTYSDGRNSLEEMVRHCSALGYEYIGITDHSQSAAYAGGLNAYAIQQQHEEIDRLNEEIAPFKIFKGIESDIRSDGALDYEEAVLASFDFVIASVHSNLKMDSARATHRLLRAISNPFTTMLGHPTGRLLLQREGYPIDHEAIINACATYKVVIEINANPWRLDLDWRWIPYAIRKHVWLSINPDAHTKEGYSNIDYGVCVARKGGLSKAHTFNALSREAVEKYFQNRKKKILPTKSPQQQK